MSDDATLASVLYGGSSTRVQATDAVPAAPETLAPPPAIAQQHELAATLYAKPAEPVVDVPESVAKLREGNDPTASKLYPDPPPHHDIQAAVNALGDDPVAMAIPAVEWQRIAHDVGAVGEDVTLAVTTIQRFAANPPTDEEVETNNAKSRAELERVFGDEAAQVLERTRALARRDPRLLDQLERSGAGSDPAVVLALAHLAQREHARGRLT